MPPIRLFAYRRSCHQIPMMLIFSYRPLPSFALRLFVFRLKWGYNPPLFSAVLLPVSIWDLLYIKTVLIASAVYFGLLFCLLGR